jgi:hypothetical protein
LGVVTDTALLEEANNYGAAGGKPQVVWPNGILASGAVSLLMQLVTPWHENPVESAFLEYDGNRHTLVHGERHKRMMGKACKHYATSDLGDPLFDARRISWEANDQDEEQLTKCETEIAQISKKPGWWRKFKSLF